MIKLETLVTFLVLQNLNKWDPMGLSPGEGGLGAPFDEYLSYAEAVRLYLAKFTEKIEPKLLASFIAAQFSQAFGVKIESSPELLKISENIIYHANLLRINRPVKRE